MRRLLPALMIAAAAALGARAALDDPPGPSAAAGEGRVTRVVDGDTLHVSVGGRDETVRLIGIDTPELHRPQTPVECAARDAATALERLAARRRVRLVGDRTQATRDRYGRRLAYVETAAGGDLGEAQVRAGWAAVYVYQGHAFARVARYAAAARAARAGGRGVERRCAGDFHSAS